MFQRTTATDKILNLTKRYRVVQGGTSAGKTYAIIATLINEAIIKPNILIDVVSMTYDHLASGAINDFKNIMQATGRWRDEFWNETKHIYTFSNLSRIRFKALDKEGKARGPRRTILYVNEANFISFDIFDQLANRTDDYIIMDFNPSNRFWAHEEILTRADSEFLLLTYRDNEALKPNILKEFQIKRERAKTSKHWENWCRVYLDGEVGRVEGVIFENWSEIDGVPPEAELIAYGMDFGFSQDPTAVIGVWRWNGEVILDEVLYATGMLNSQIIHFLEKEGISKRDTIIADSAEPKSISEFKSWGWNVQGANKGKDSVLFGINLMQEHTIRITKRSLNLIEEFTKYSWKKGANNTPEDMWNHGCDAARYVFLNRLSNKWNPNSFKTYSTDEIGIKADLEKKRAIERRMRGLR